MAHAQKPDFVFRWNGQVHLNRWGRQFSRLLATEVCASAVVMLVKPCSEVVCRVLATHSICQFPLHFPSRASPCAITFQLDSTCLCPEPLAVRYLGLVLDSEVLYAQHLHTVANKATGVLFDILPFPVRDSTFTQSKKLSLYKLLFRSILTYAAPVPPTAATPSYRNHPRSTPNSYLHDKHWAHPNYHPPL